MKKLSIEQFIERANLVHSGKYYYTSSVYVNTRTKIKIICPDHGVFEQNAHDHLNGHGCYFCGNTKIQKINSFTLDQFINKAELVHSGRYNYSSVVYNNRAKVDIICPIHGVFRQTPDSHLSGHGCRWCFSDKLKEGMTFTTDEFIRKANYIHNNKYTYEAVQYEHNAKKVIINCPIHGYFLQAANSHLQGRGCTECANTGFFHSKSAVLYCIRFDNVIEIPIYKIGVTGGDVKERIQGLGIKKGVKPTVLVTILFESGGEALKIEQHLHLKYKNYRYLGEKFTRKGYTEMYIKDIIGCDYKNLRI